MKFSQQEYWSVLLFAPPVDHILSELFIMTGLSWVIQHGLTDSFRVMQVPSSRTTRLWSMKGEEKEPKIEKLYTARKKTRSGADCDSDHQLLIYCKFQT